MAAAAASPETALPPTADPEYEEDDDGEEECRICRLPAEADRPLRRPCACRGSIKFVHDDCQLRWLAARHQNQCEVCNFVISTRPLYAADAPARLPLSELMVSLPNKLLGLLVPLLFAVYVVCDSFIHLATLWTWRIAFARTFLQAFRLLSFRVRPSSVFASIALWVVFLHSLVPFAVAPFARWVARLETRRQGFSGLDGLQALALTAVEASLTVVIGDMVLACILGFLPFSLGRIILWWSSYFNLSNVEGVEFYTSTISTLLIGYGFIFTVGACFAGLHTLHHYLKGEQLGIALFIRRLSGMFFRGIVYLITVANIGFNLLNLMILRPLFFGWLLDICTSKMFGATLSQRFKLLTASSLSSTALHWLLGHIFLNLRPRLSRFLHKVLKLGVTISFSSVHHNVYEPFYTFYLKKLLCLLVDTIFVALVVFVPIEVADRLSPEVFPLDITYFDRPGKGTSVWQGPQKYAVSLSAILHIRFLISNTMVYLEWLVERVIGYWFVTSGKALGSNDAPKDQNGSSDEANDKSRTFVVVRTMLRVVLAWLTAVIFNTAMIFCPISVWRALLFAIPQLPVADELKSNDLFAIAVGFFIISTIVATFRDIFACMTFRGPWLVDLKRHLLVFLWMVVAPYMMGLLVDLSLISPFIGPDDDFPVLDFFCTWSLGWQVKNLWMNMARFTAAAPFLAYFIDERWDGKLTQARVDWSSGAISLSWFFQDIYIPVATKLLAALGLPYLLAKGLFPRLGCSAAVNSTVYRFAWLSSLGFYVICYLGKVLCIKLHDSIRDDHYIIGERLQDIADCS
ncbi:probable E3 ubiquitin ligase SUD1 isoform X1 [Lolium rigidum]|uniref:probable E3 ubiquitin ligase SUD1 isoform X1 n=1 Tax=Lolium rigidum TaxID=89674 RepID=UPI001F5DD2C7|nr:probable E3 ubiquitin ligase SUD1 isoform X1 [Lolium rigidum]